MFAVPTTLASSGTLNVHSHLPSPVTSTSVGVCLRPPAYSTRREHLPLILGLVLTVIFCSLPRPIVDLGSMETWKLAAAGAAAAGAGPAAGAGAAGAGAPGAGAAAGAG